jgi:hypothetical protein
MQLLFCLAATSNAASYNSIEIASVTSTQAKLRSYMMAQFEVDLLHSKKSLHTRNVCACSTAAKENGELP